MSTTSATDPPKPRRRLDRMAAVPVTGTRFRPCSRRGLYHRLVVVRQCPLCGDAHTFRDDGLRIASCGLGYLMVKARNARGTASRRGGQATVDGGTVDGVDSFARGSHTALTSAPTSPLFPQKRIPTVDANSSAPREVDA